MSNLKRNEWKPIDGIICVLFYIVFFAIVILGYKMVIYPT